MCSPGAGTPQKCCVKSAQYLRSDLIYVLSRASEHDKILRFSPDLKHFSKIP